MITKRESLSPKERLRLNKDFKKVLETGKKFWLDRYLLIIYAPNHLNYRRLGLIVSKKIGKATERNRVKRLLRELFRKNKDIFPQGVDLIMIPHPNIKKLDYNVLVTLLKKELENFQEV